MSVPGASAASLLVLATLAQAQTDPPPTDPAARPAATPYRPSVSTPAALSAPGWLEVEAGGLRGRSADDPQRRSSLPYTLKLAFTPDWGLRLGGDAWVQERDADGTTRRGGGDTTLVAKRRFALDEAQALGLELGLKLPTAAAGLGSGHTDWNLNGIWSRDFAGGWHVDANLAATRLGGDPGPGSSRWQRALAVAASHALDERWSAVGELSATAQPGTAHTAQALFAASYALGPSIVLDAGASKGLNRASGGWSVFAGLSFVAVRLF